jgi:hypothetical protein
VLGVHDGGAGEGRWNINRQEERGGERRRRRWEEAVGRGLKAAAVFKASHI